MATFENRISAAIDEATQAVIAASIKSINDGLPFLINLDLLERRAKRKTGTKREGYVVDVYTAGLAHPEVIPDAFDMDEWTKDEVLNTVLKGIQSSILSLAESIDDTLLQIGSERMKQADLVYGYLKGGAKGNAALTEIVENIGTQFAGQGVKKPIPVVSIPPGGSVNISNAVPSTMLSNMGNTVLKMSSNGIDTLIRPGDVAKVPLKSVVITNQSTTTEGSFSVKTQ